MKATVSPITFYTETGELVKTFLVKVTLDNGSLILMEFYTEEEALRYIKGLRGRR